MPHLPICGKRLSIFRIELPPLAHGQRSLVGLSIKDFGVWPGATRHFCIPLSGQAPAIFMLAPASCTNRFFNRLSGHTIRS